MNAYRSLEADLHDFFWSQDDSPELEWLGALLSAHPGRALEVGCGSGRLLLPLLARGCHVEGLDNSPEMLALCREKSARSGLSPELWSGSMDDFLAPIPYDHILLPTFGLQLSAQPQAALAHLAHQLHPGGRFYLTLFVPYAELEGELPEKEWYLDREMILPDGRHARVDTRHQLDLRRQILHREHRYRLASPDPRGSVREHHSRQTIHWLTPLEVLASLHALHFQIESACAEFDTGTPLDEEAEIFTLVARREG